MDHDAPRGFDIEVAALTDGTVEIRIDAGHGLVVTMLTTARSAADLSESLARVAAVAHEITERR